MAYSNKVIIILAIFVANIFYFFPNKTQAAVTVTISNTPSTVSTDSFTLNVLVSGASAGTNYLRVDMFKDGTTSYFGETYNGTSWYNGSDFSRYLPISIVSGTDWTGKLQGRLGSILIENDLYKLKVRRYTSQNSYTFSNIADININLPTPTPTSTPITQTPTPSPTITLTEAPTITLATAAISYNNVFLSEVMVYPESGENEWIELYNNNDSSVSLQNWYFDDQENDGSSPKVFSLEISSKGYAVYNLTSSMFNNDDDSVRLLDFNKNLKDSFEYKSGSRNKSLGRINLESNDFCLQEPSKGTQNNSCLNPTNTPTPTPSPTPSTSLQIAKTQTVSPTPSNNLVEMVGTEDLLESQNNISDLSQTDTGEVLSTHTKMNQTFPLINYLTFLSFSFSLLAMISVLIKVKRNGVYF